MSKTKIRKISESDIDDVVELIARTKQISFSKISPPALVADKLNEHTSEGMKQRVNGGEYYVAVTEGSVSGIIGYKDSEIRTFFVDPKMQGKGIGRKLYDAAEQIARDAGVKVLTVNAAPTGQPIYEHFGFVRVGTMQKERVGIKYEDAIMEKQL